VEVNPKILIIGDDLDAAEMLKACFRAQGCEAYTACAPVPAGRFEDAEQLNVDLLRQRK